MAATASINEEQFKLLEDALQVVRTHGAKMRQCLDPRNTHYQHHHQQQRDATPGSTSTINNNRDSHILDAIKHCSAMLGELRTSALTPKSYYELFLAVFDSLQLLISSLRDAHESGRHHLADLYELVQYAGNVVPRLYLMVTVGSTFMGLRSSSVANSKNIDNSGGSQRDTTTTPIALNSQDLANNTATPVATTTAETTPDSEGVSQDGDEISGEENEEEEEEIPVHEVMMDMLEMVRGVQHPTRGLFLRYYLGQMTKDKLASASVSDAIQFTLTNFTEMNKLWVRLQHLGLSREREKRELERKELRTLVGSNLIRLASLDGVTLEHYTDIILPHLLRQVISCKDPLAQEYLMEAIVQAFSDDWHIATLGQLVDVLGKLHPKVAIKGIIVALVNRIQVYVSKFQSTTTTTTAAAAATNSKKGKENESEQKQEEEEEEGEGEQEKKSASEPSSQELFEKLWGHVQNLVSVRSDLPTSDMVAILCSMLRLSLAGAERNPDSAKQVSQVIAFVQGQMQRRSTFYDINSTATTNQLLGFLLSPLRAYPNPIKILELKDYQELLSGQNDLIQKNVGTALVTAMLQRETIMSTVEHVKGIFGICSKLIVGGVLQSSSNAKESRRRREGKSSLPEMDEEDIAEEQGLLARLVHLIQAEDPETQTSALISARNALVEGRVEYTFPAIITAAINLVSLYGETKPGSAGNIEGDEAAVAAAGQEGAGDDSNNSAPDNKDLERQISEWRRKVQHLLRFIKATIDQVPKESTALQLSIMSAQAVASEPAFTGDEDLEEAAYELFVQAFTVYEERVSDSRVQFNILMQLVGAVHASRNFSSENYENLSDKCVVYGTKLLKRPDQARVAFACSFLWWRNDPVTDNGDKTIKQLIKSFRVADSVLDPAIRMQLLIELLNRAIAHYERECPSVTPKYLTDLIQSIHIILEDRDLLDTSESAKARRGSSSSNKRGPYPTILGVGKYEDTDANDPSSIWTPSNMAPSEWIPKFFADTIDYIQTGDFPGVRTMADSVATAPGAGIGAASGSPEIDSILDHSTSSVFD
ncbi:retromer complex subunit Vps35 [Mycoemilia scoparia]|uniref:Vacuolar protein sorting-associated protein 35 n=1 Tax=Mycoemilia scoparia TaxID=417184 RepID=A0A9W8DKP9_9FUNG|nr:retromer complex subunit Vps35 [Mycoemilia scoparia]